VRLQGLHSRAHRPRRRPRYGAPSSTVHLRVGSNFFVSHNVDEVGRKYLYLFKVVRYAFCRAVSVIRICPRVPAPKGVKLVLSYPKKSKGGETLANDQLFSHEQKTEFEVACSDLADGLPDPDKMSYQLIVSKCVLTK
jgi:E3 ubiquitin-protein ligase SIAH1